MAAVHLIVPLQEVRGQCETAWLEACGIRVDALPMGGRYPTWAELLAAVGRLEATTFEVHESGLEAQVHLYRSEEWATLEALRADASSIDVPLSSMLYRGWDTLAFTLLQDLEVVCGGLLLLFTNAESPRLVRLGP